jgi:hypothetical protein
MAAIPINTVSSSINASEMVEAGLHSLDKPERSKNTGKKVKCRFNPSLAWKEK